jgi:hypothetical protein
MNRKWVAGLVVVAMVALWLQSWNGQVGIRNRLVDNCKRGQLDRRANANGWQTARLARLATAKQETGPKRAADLVAAARYRRIVATLNARITTRNREYRCDKAFPNPGPFG